MVTHQYAVEELVHTKAQDTHHQVDDVVHEPKVGQHLPRLLGERALVPHHTYQIYTFIYHLHKKNKTCFITVLQYVTGYLKLSWKYLYSEEKNSFQCLTLGFRARNDIFSTYIKCT